MNFKAGEKRHSEMRMLGGRNESTLKLFPLEGFRQDWEEVVHTEALFIVFHLLLIKQGCSKRFP